jgi:dynein heavy chain 1
MQGAPPPPSLLTQRRIADMIAPAFEPEGLVSKALAYAASRPHIMDFTRLRVLTSFFSLLNRGILNVLEYNAAHPDFPLPDDRHAITFSLYRRASSCEA